MKNTIREVFSCFSRLFNVCMGGTADISYSARAHRDRLEAPEATINKVFYALFGEIDHCRNWWLVEVERSRTNVAIHNANKSRVL